MKFHGDRKYLYWGITAFAVIASGIFVYYCLFHGTKISAIFNQIVSICFPIIVGFCLAYLITPIINSIEYRILIPLSKKVSKNSKNKSSKNRKKLFRAISIFIAYMIVFWCIYGLFAMIIPEIETSITSIIKQFPETFDKYYTMLLNFINDNKDVSNFLEDTLSFDIKSIDSEKVINIILTQVENIGSILSTLSTTVYSALKTTLNVVIGMIISVYLLFDKERFAAQAKKICYSLLEMHNANQLIKDCRFIHKTFIGFISGKIFDSIIIGVLCFIGTTILHLHYPILISVIVGVTNVIPFFGPWLGAIPCAFLLLIINPIEMVYFLIFILFLQQLDGNVIGPKILGNSTGISGFWVIFAITFFGGMYGIPGMFIGVPVFAVIYAFTRRFINRKLKAKDLPIETPEYENVYEIHNKEFITKDHLYTEIQNPDSNRKASDIQDEGRYHLFRFLQKNEKDSSSTSEDSLSSIAKDKLTSLLHKNQDEAEATGESHEDKDEKENK